MHAIRKMLLLLLGLSGIFEGYSQYKYTDSLTYVAEKTKDISSKIDELYDLSYQYQVSRPDSALMVAKELYDFSIETGNEYGTSLALDAMAGAFLRIGDNAKALEYYLMRLELAEKLNEADDIAILYMNIANVYNRNQDTAKAIRYILRADSIIQKNKYEDLKLYAWLNSGNIFEKANHLDSALLYTYKCYSLALRKMDTLMIGSALNNLGNIYYKSQDYFSAIEKYRQSEVYVLAQNDNQTLTEGYLGLARSYLANHMKDSSLYFARKAYSVSYHHAILNNALHASQLLALMYSDAQQFDSAFRYQSVMIALKDSISSQEKIKQLESLSIQEQLRQQELANLQQKEKEEYRKRLQLLAIGIAIPFFFLFSIFISKQKVNRKFIQFFGILSLLLFFEYLSLFLHPFITTVTHHNLFLEIMILVAIGSLLVPGHHRVEHWFMKRLTTNYEGVVKKSTEVVGKKIAITPAAVEEMGTGEERSDNAVYDDRVLPED